MSCDYCTKKADYMFQDSERACKSCLRELPNTLREAKHKIVELTSELTSSYKMNTSIDNSICFQDEIIGYLLNEKTIPNLLLWIGSQSHLDEKLKLQFIDFVMTQVSEGQL